MKKKIVAFAVIGVLFFSCSTASEDYAKAATELCDCMYESGYDESDAANIKMNIGVCLLDAKVDLKDPQMITELDEKCSDIKEGFEEFVKNM
jgi:hypothetical protein